jgi:hypothetical protein
MFVEMSNEKRKETDEMRGIIELCNEVIVELQLGFHFNKAFHHSPPPEKLHLIVVTIKALTGIVSPQSTMKKSPECETMAMKCESHSHVLSCEVKCE